jgi:hypothetical protein
MPPQASFQNPTEEMVYTLCKESFLSLWSYPNPRRHDSGKELCDVLVVCNPHVIVFSVKHSEFNKNTDVAIARDRWLRKTVHESMDQIYGAERNLTTANYVIKESGDQGLPLPPLAERRMHRVCVSLGGGRQVALSPIDGGKGIVHCFDEQFVVLALQELDTVVDFVEYLDARERFIEAGQRVEGLDGEEHLLALYLHNGKRFPEAELINIEGDLWSSLQRNPAYQRRLHEDRISYAWDNLIEYVAEYVATRRMVFSEDVAQNEAALRVMARESRFERRMLSQMLLEFRAAAERRAVRARMVGSSSGVTYVFFNPPASFDRQARIGELFCRCWVARDETASNETVLGVGINVQPAPEGYAVDLVLLDIADWTKEHQRNAHQMREELGFFKKPLFHTQHFDEYPEL